MITSSFSPDLKLLSSENTANFFSLYLKTKFLDKSLLAKFFISKPLESQKRSDYNVVKGQG